MTSRRSKRRERRAQARSGSSQKEKSAKTSLRLDSLAALGVAVLLVATVAVIYSPVSTFRFISLDDPQYVSANSMVAQGLSLAGIKWAFTASSFYWHPLTWISHMLDVELWGMNSGAHHTVNVVFHATNSAVLFVSLRRMTRATWPSAVVAALFAVHPLHVESVAWVSERKDVLSTLFLMLSLLAYSVYVERRSWVSRIALILVFALGLLAKPMIATLPFVFLLLDLWPLKRVASGAENMFQSWVPLLLEKIPLFALSFASVAATLVSQNAIVATQSLTLAERARNALVSYSLYLRDTVWPRGLAPFYPLSPPRWMPVAAAIAVLCLLTYGALRLRKRFPYLIVGWLWFLGTLLPVIGLVQAGDQGRADRFTYVPLIGVFIAVVWLVNDLLSPIDSTRLIRRAGAVATIAVLAVLARAQLSYWKDDISLWGRAVSATHDNYRAENHFGVALTDNGRLDEGITHYEAALRIWPDYPQAHNNLGTARMDQARYNDAVKEFGAAVRLRPHDATFRYNFAVALNAAGKPADALKEVYAGLEIDPKNADLLRARDVIRYQSPQH